MTEPYGSLTFSAADLGAPEEQEWQRLRQQLELAEGFWLGFVFVPSPRQAADLRSRTEQLLRAHARGIKVVSPPKPDELRSALSAGISILNTDSDSHQHLAVCKPKVRARV